MPRTIRAHTVTHQRRPPRDTAGKNALIKFDNALSKKYEKQLENFSEEELRKLEELNELCRKIGSEEASDRLRDLGGISRLGHCGGNDLVNHGAAVKIVLTEHKGP